MKSKKAKIISGSICCVVFIATLVLFTIFYLVPYNEVKAGYNDARKQYDAGITTLKDISKEINDNIDLLNKIIIAEDIPLDEFMISSAREIIKDASECSENSIPKAPRAPLSIEKVEPVTLEVVKLTGSVNEMIEHNNQMLKEVKDTEAEYRSLIANFKTGKPEVEWIGVDKENTVLRFVTKISNPNNAILRDINIEWTAYDADGAVVGNYSGSQPDIPANGYVYYVGGAGSANLSGTPATVDVKITTEGLLTNRVAPKIDVSNVNLRSDYFSWDVSAECVTDTEIKTSQLSGLLFVKDADEKIIEANFWRADNLPDTIKENGKFKFLESLYDLPTIPKSAEVYMYYIWD